MGTLFAIPHDASWRLKTIRIAVTTAITIIITIAIVIVITVAITMVITIAITIVITRSQLDSSKCNCRGVFI